MIEHIRPAELAAWFAAAGCRPLVLDVREPWELQTASVRGLVSRHRSDVVGCAQPSERIAQPIPSVLASDATPRCGSRASADRQMIGDATLELLAIPMGALPASLAGLDPARPIACLCHHGARSLRVAEFLARSGFSRVANITGGIDAWAQESDPTVPRY